MYSRSVKTVRTDIFAKKKNAYCLKLQLLILFFAKSIISDKQNQVCRSVKAVHTYLLAQYISQLYKLATTNSNFF